MLATIGYERATLADFIATLQVAMVDVLVDVRERAQSRRPGFSKRTLQIALENVGIEYLHYPELGDPKDGRDAARAGDMQRFSEIYDVVINSSRAITALEKLEALASTKTVCLMCFERDQTECHRKIVADKLEGRLGLKASHWGVKAGAARDSSARRMLHIDKGATASL